MLKSTIRTLVSLETQAADHTCDVFKSLRKLGLCEYGLLLQSIPNSAFPNLSKKIPRMNSPEVQKIFTGVAGNALLSASLDFTNFFAKQVLAYSGMNLGQLLDARLLDYGCGWGRLMRLMYYYFSSPNVFGVDPWQKAIDECQAAGLGGNVFKIDNAASDLISHSKYDVGYAFSVFTHLPSDLLKEVLGNIRDCIKSSGIFVITIRPPEYWDYVMLLPRNKTSAANTKEIQQAIARHEKEGFSYISHNNESLLSFGDTSIDIEWLAKNLKYWEIIGQDRSLNDPFQLYVTLRASA
jgi:2-polyprenyl-3-methyl-5-hydroxy-6-metoxy-1,4-benzoquinol methylase